MCGRYYIADDDRLADMVRRLSEELSQPLATGEICPGSKAAVFLGNQKLNMAALKWGFDMGSGRPLINARSESVDSKPMFAPLLKEHRIFVPASSYFEWDGEKHRHTLGVEGSGIYMAGLYRPNDNSFVILTRAAAQGISHIHHRMPVIFSRQTALEWLKQANNPMRVLEAAQTDIIKEVAL